MNDEDEIKFEDLANNLYIGEGDEYEGETLEEFIEDIEDFYASEGRTLHVDSPKFDGKPFSEFMESGETNPDTVQLLGDLDVSGTEGKYIHRKSYTAPIMKEPSLSERYKEYSENNKDSNTSSTNKNPYNRNFNNYSTDDDYDADDDYPYNTEYDADNDLDDTRFTYNLGVDDEDDNTYDPDGDDFNNAHVEESYDEDDELDVETYRKHLHKIYDILMKIDDMEFNINSADVYLPHFLIYEMRAKRFRNFKSPHREFDSDAKEVRTGANRIIKKLKVLKEKLRAKILEFIVANAHTIGIVLLVLVAILVLVFGVVAVVEMLNPFGPNGMSSVDGITGKDFYGARMIYKDEEKANAEIIEDYVSLIGNSTKSVELAEGEITINLTLPENYVYSAFNEETFSVDYQHGYYILNSMVDAAYLSDVGVAPETEVALVEKVNGIKYFGIESTWDFAGLVSNYINANDLYSVEGATLTEQEIENEISADIASYFASVPTTRADRLYVKDYILYGEDDMLTSIPKKQYVSMIFMPKRNVSFKSFSLIVSGADFDNFSVNIVNGNHVEELDKSLFLIDDKTDDKSYAYKSALLKNLRLETSSFTDINLSKLNELEQEKSVYSIVKDLNSSTYLTTKTTAEDKTVYTPKLNGVYVEFSSNQAFAFAEEYTKIED